LDRNTAYAVSLTLTGLGSTDPNTPVAKGNVKVSINIQGWSTSCDYDEVI